MACSQKRRIEINQKSPWCPLCSENPLWCQTKKNGFSSSWYVKPVSLLLHPWGLASLKEEAAVSYPAPSAIIDCWVFKNNLRLENKVITQNFQATFGRGKKKKKVVEQASPKNNLKKKKVHQKDSLIKCICSTDPGQKWFCSGKLHLYVNIVFSNRTVFSAQHHWERQTVCWMFNNMPYGFLLLKSHFTGMAPLREVCRVTWGNRWTNTT